MNKVTLKNKILLKKPIGKVFGIVEVKRLAVKKDQTSVVEFIDH